MNASTNNGDLDSSAWPALLPLVIARIEKVWNHAHDPDDGSCLVMKKGPNR